MELELINLELELKFPTKIFDQFHQLLTMLICRERMINVLKPGRHQLCQLVYKYLIQADVNCAI